MKLLFCSELIKEEQQAPARLSGSSSRAFKLHTQKGPAGARIQTKNFQLRWHECMVTWIHSTSPRLTSTESLLLRKVATPSQETEKRAQTTWTLLEFSLQLLNKKCAPKTFWLFSRTAGIMCETSERRDTASFPLERNFIDNSLELN